MAATKAGDISSIHSRWWCQRGIIDGFSPQEKESNGMTKFSVLLSIVPVIFLAGCTEERAVPPEHRICIHNQATSCD